MPHKLIDTSSLKVQPGYNDLVRTPKETAANAKDVAQMMEQRGDEPTLFPITYVKIGKELFTRNHATLLAAQNRGWEKIYAMESPHEPGSAADYLDLIVSNNGGHPLTRVAQGKLYKTLLDGEGPGEEEIAAAKVGEEPAWKRAPMTLQEIEDAMAGSISKEGIRLNILLAESTPEIAELLETDQVSGGVVISAKALAKDDDAKTLKIVRSAIKKAASEGKPKATGKHFDAIKADFAPKLKAARDEKPESTSTASESKSDESEGDENEEDGGEETESLPTGETLPPESGNQSGDLFAHGSRETIDPDNHHALLAKWKSILMDADNTENVTLSESTVDELVEKLHAVLTETVF